LIFSKQDPDENYKDHVGKELRQPGPACHIHVDYVLGSSVLDNLCEKKKVTMQEKT
jgi:hypothetical protein